MKNHFKIGPNIYCCFIDTVGSLGVPETCLGGSGAISGCTWAPRAISKIFREIPGELWAPF